MKGREITNFLFTFFYHMYLIGNRLTFIKSDKSFRSLENKNV